MKVRSFFYQTSIFHSYRPPALTISVGNLTMGGTGKTPFVQEISKELQKKGFKVAIVSRGYGGSSRKKVNLVSAGAEPLLSAEAAGDEARLHADSLTGVIVATGANRKLPCQYVINHLGCNAIVLDDGFQHMAVQRDINLVLFNSSVLAGSSRVFPGGELREPVSSLLRADAFIMTGTTDNNRDRAKRFAELLEKRFPNRPVFHSTCKAVKIRKLGENKTFSIDRLPSPLFGFCGIAHPQRFREILAELDLQLSGFSSFKDHQPYNKSRFDRLLDMADKAGAKALITTEKDMVKLSNHQSRLPIFSLVTETTIEDSFWNFFYERLDQFSEQTSV